MANISQCAECGAPLPECWPKGLCSRCALQGALELSLPTDAGTEPQNPEIADVAPAALPRRFGDYELLQEIARGGMGVVFKARQISLDRVVAVKMLLSGILASPELLRRFKVEAVAAGSLQHPNIVSIHEVGIHEGQHFIVMDYVPGPNLAKLTREQLSPTRAAGYVKSVARAVHYAHERGILHRDLKPSNVLIDPNDQPRITDFGLAKRLNGDSSLTLSGHVLGSPSYMPPEQAAATNQKVSPRSDVYSLGAMLYNLLTGRPPFVGESVGATLRQVESAEPLSPRLLNPGVPRDLETICLKCLEKDPQRRYDSAEALAQDLEHWLQHEPIHARRASSFVRLSRWTRRNPVGATLILSLCVGFAVSLSLLKVALDQKDAADRARMASDRAREIIWQEIGVSDFWEKPDSTATVSAEVLALVSGRQRIASATGKIERLRIGMLLEEYPVDVIIGYAHLLGYLEDHLNKARENPVRFDLKVYQENQMAIDALVHREVDLLKIGGRSYLLASKADPGITPLVSQNPSKSGVIFTRQDSGIKTLADLTGKSIAVGAPTSTIRLWAIFHLAQAGMRSANLKIVSRADPTVQPARLRKAPKLGKGQKITDLSPIVQAVWTNGCEAGAVSERAFRRFQATNDALVVLKAFPSSPVFWLASSGLSPEIAGGIRHALANLRDEAMFKGLADNVSSYSEVSVEEVSLLRQAAATIGEQFGADSEESE